jgi:hypothetical protein
MESDLCRSGMSMHVTKVRLEAYYMRSHRGISFACRTRASRSSVSRGGRVMERNLETEIRICAHVTLCAHIPKRSSVR